MTNFLENAKRKFPQAHRIMGSGRYACARPDGSIVYLCETESQQRSASLSMNNPVFVDLKFPNGVPTEVFDKMKDRYEGRD
jgi:hypothetical protein